jgi:hypothetical protein
MARKHNDDLRAIPTTHAPLPNRDDAVVNLARTIARALARGHHAQETQRRSDAGE